MIDFHKLDPETQEEIRQLHIHFANEFLDYKDDNVLRAHYNGRLWMLEELFGPDNFRNNEKDNSRTH